VEIDGKISIGEANCNEIDTYDRNEGIRIAVTRALGIDPFDVSTKPKEELEVKRIPLYMQLNEMQKSIGAMGGRILKAHSVTSNPKLPAFDWNKFKGRFQRVAVNCKNKKEAEDFLRACGKHGIKAHENYGDLITWNERRVLSKVANCFIYDSRDGLLYFGSDSYFIGNGYEVLNWSDYQSAESDAQSLADILSEI
jgi:hypothetical protein